MTSTDQGPASAGPLFLLKRGLGLLDRAVYGVIIAAMTGMTGLVATQVFVRYVLGSSIDSADELSRLFFIWAMFMAIPHGIKLGIHVSIDIVIKQLNPSVQEVLFRLMCVASAILMILVFYMAAFVAADKWQELMPTIDVTAAVYYIPVLLSAGHSVLHLLVFAWGGSKVWGEALAQ
ncbi:MAG: TRAP transporter small permease subunit [Rhodospirillales bacterium]|jgi:TRAP-type C4-dicarboxylate transport system permease small subunit|nr:TRAP transporter small permease subunit [Rhodospirillales bacterium]